NRLQFEIEATHCRGTSASATVDAERYAWMEWPEALGSLFAVSSGRGVRDQLREAIQLLSHRDGGVPRASIYTSLGWHVHGGKWIYCQAGGAIGAGDGCAVELHESLAAYRLPEPTKDDNLLRLCFRDHLAIRKLADSGKPGARGAAALLETLPWRAALKAFNAMVHLAGPSGNRKTSTGQLLVQHYSTDIRGRLFSPP